MNCKQKLSIGGWIRFCFVFFEKTIFSGKIYAIVHLDPSSRSTSHATRPITKTIIRKRSNYELPLFRSTHKKSTNVPQKHLSEVRSIHFRCALPLFNTPPPHFSSFFHHPSTGLQIKIDNFCPTAITLHVAFVLCSSFISLPPFPTAFGFASSRHSRLLLWM